MPERTLEQKISLRMKIILGLALIAVVDTAYLLYNHYSEEPSFCEFGGAISCDIVNKSKYAEVFGIPTALLGILYYVFVSAVAYAWICKCDFRKIIRKLRPGLVLRWLFGLTFVGLLFSLYLTYIEFFKLKTICPLCVVQQIIIAVIFGLLYSIQISIDLEKKKTNACEFC